MKRSNFVIVMGCTLLCMAVCMSAYGVWKVNKPAKKVAVAKKKTAKQSKVSDLSTPDKAVEYFTNHDFEIPVTEAALRSNMEVARTIAPSILKSFDVRFPSDSSLNQGAKLIKYGQYLRMYMGEKAMTTYAMLDASKYSIRYKVFVNAYLTEEIASKMQTEKERTAYYNAVLAGNKFLEASVGYIAMISSMEAYGGTMSSIKAGNGAEDAFDAWNEMIEKQVAIVRGDQLEGGENLPEHWQKYAQECLKSKEKALAELKASPEYDYEGQSENTIVQYVQQMDSLANNALSGYQRWIAESGLGGSGSSLERAAGTMLKEWQKLVK